MRYDKMKKQWLADDGTIYAEDKKTIIGKVTILNRFRPGPQPETWVDNRGNLYGPDRRTILKTSDEIANERLKEKKSRERQEAEEKLSEQLRKSKIESKRKREENRLAQEKINQHKFDEAFGRRPH